MNRRYFSDEAEKLLVLSRRSRLMSAIIYLDLDGFKAVNDTPRPRCGRFSFAVGGRPAKGARAAERTSWRASGATSLSSFFLTPPRRRASPPRGATKTRSCSLSRFVVACSTCGAALDSRTFRTMATRWTSSCPTPTRPCTRPRRWEAGFTSTRRRRACSGNVFRLRFVEVCRRY